MKFSGQINSQIIQSTSQIQAQQTQQQSQYPVVVQKLIPVQIYHPQQIYSTALPTTTTVPKISIVQADINQNNTQIQNIHQLPQQQYQLKQSQGISQKFVQTSSTNIKSVQLEEKQRAFERDNRENKQICDQLVKSDQLEELVGKKDFEIQQLQAKLSQQEQRNMETLQTLGKTMQVEKMKLLEKNNQEQNDFMEQIRRKQVEEYEEVLEENRKLQLEINKLTREKEGISGRLEISRQELKENAERRRQIIDLEQKLKDRELDIFKQKQYSSQLEMKIEELIAENRKLSEGAELQLDQNEELMKKTQYAEQTVRNAMDSKFMVERQVEELHLKANQQQEYLNKVLEKLANVQRENEEMGQKVNMWEQEGIRMTTEMRNQQGYAMDLVGKLKTVENEKLILEDKIDKLERLLRQVKEKAEREERMRREIFEEQEDRARDNGELVARLEEMGELVETKNKKIQKMNRKVKRIEEQVGSQTNEVTQMIKQKEEEIQKILKINKQLNEEKKKYKEKMEEKQKEVESIVQQYQETKQGLDHQEKELREVMLTTTTIGQKHDEYKQKYEEMVHENEKLREKYKDLEEKLKKMYEDNQTLFHENKKIKQIIAQFQQNEAAYYQCVEDNKILRKQLDEERIINQQKFEEMAHKLSFSQQQEQIKINQQWKIERQQIERLQDKFRINEQNYEAQINQLQCTLNKIQNDNLHIQAHGQHSFETLLIDFEQIQLHNKFLVEQLKQYECKIENLLIMQERSMGDQCCYFLPNQTMPLLPIQTNVIAPPQVLLNKPYTPNYGAVTMKRTYQIGDNTPTYKMNHNDDRLNEKIYKRCREIVTQYD